MTLQVRLLKTCSHCADDKHNPGGVTFLLTITAVTVIVYKQNFQETWMVDRDAYP